MQDEAVMRVALVAPALVRGGLRALLAESGRLTILAEASDIRRLARAAGEVDVLLLAESEPDPDLPAHLENWLAGTAPDLAQSPALLLFTTTPGSKDCLALPWRAWGLLAFEAAPAELSAALLALQAGLCVAPPALFDPQWLALPIEPAPSQAAQEPLTEREQEVLGLLVQGLANKQMALALGISEHTVKFHISSIYAKLGASNRTEAMRLGVQRGWVTL